MASTGSPDYFVKSEEDVIRVSLPLDDLCRALARTLSVRVCTYVRPCVHACVYVFVCVCVVSVVFGTNDRESLQYKLLFLVCIKETPNLSYKKVLTQLNRLMFLYSNFIYLLITIRYILTTIGHRSILLIIFYYNI